MITSKRLVFSLSFGLLVAVWMAHGREIQVDFDHCSHLKFGREIVSEEDLTISAFELYGIVRSNTDDKTLDNMSSECNNLFVRNAQGINAPGYCKYLASDDSYFVNEASCDSSGCSWKVIYGTGMFEGATGSASFKSITQAKPISKGNFQGCTRHVGTMTIPDAK